MGRSDFSDLGDTHIVRVTLGTTEPPAPAFKYIDIWNPKGYDNMTEMEKRKLWDQIARAEDLWFKKMGIK